jgi:pimeloyl-ACP methyl ester carboxylesterase
MPTIRAEDLAIAYEVIGAGEPLVMLHGATSSGRESFGSLITALAESFELYLPDARGHGGTRWDAANGFRAEWLVDDLRGFVDALGLRAFHLLGYSMGAMTALDFATRAPERVRTLVVVGFAPDREPRARVTRRLLDPARLQRDQPGWAAELTARLDPTQGVGAWQRLLPAIAADVATQPLLSPAELRAITGPTLVACGDRDPLVPVAQAAGLARQVRDGRLFVAPDSGHDLLTRRPALALEVLRTFYRSTESVADARAHARADDGADARSEVPG